MANLNVKVVQPADQNRNLNTEWFMYPAVWATYILIVFFSELLVSHRNPGIARNTLNLAQFPEPYSIFVMGLHGQMTDNKDAIQCGMTAAVLWWLEGLTVIDCVYGFSLCTIGYGGITFKTRAGKLFSIFWPLASKVTGANVFQHLDQVRKDETRMAYVKKFPEREITLEEFRAMDTNHCGSIRKSEYVIKENLGEVEDIGEEEVLMVSK